MRLNIWHLHLRRVGLDLWWNQKGVSAVFLYFCLNQKGSIKTWWVEELRGRVKHSTFRQMNHWRRGAAPITWKRSSLRKWNDLSVRKLNINVCSPITKQLDCFYSFDECTKLGLICQSWWVNGRWARNISRLNEANEKNPTTNLVWSVCKCGEFIVHRSFYSFLLFFFL